MGKAAKSRAKEVRRKKKRSRKEQMRSQFETWKSLGQNTKSKRSRKNAKKTSLSSSRGKHESPDCGNLGCEKCYPQYSDPWQASARSSLYSKRFTSKKWRFDALMN